MTRLILILLTIFILLTIVRNIIRRYKVNSSKPYKSDQNPKINKDKRQDDDDNIVDAKFEEIK